MKKANKFLWVKFGWSDYYRGGPVDGNFGYFKERRGGVNEGRGGEAFNFMPSADGTYYCYVPPQRGHAPSNESNSGWTVVCLAKNPRHRGIHVVGWYQNATLIGDWEKPNPVAASVGERDGSYCITSKSAFFVPLEFRNDPFSDPSVGQAKYSLLSGPGVKADENKKRVLRLLEGKLKASHDIAICNPDESRAPDPETDPGDPLAGFGTPEHRRKVEKAAERAVVKHYRSKGFQIRRVAHLNCGYDYVFIRKQTVHHVKVKGTSMAYARFFLTRNENDGRKDSRWRLGMVTDALTARPKVTIFDDHAFKRAFDVEPYVFVGTCIVEPKDA